jgi:GYF domain 2
MTAIQSVNKHLKIELISEQDAYEWYIIDPQEKKPTGPLSVRDIEVMWETNTINSQTFIWKNGMTDWKRIFQIEELKSKIEGSSTFFSHGPEDKYVPFSNSINHPIPQAQQAPKVAKPEPEKPKKTEENLTVADHLRHKLEQSNPTGGDELDEIESLEKKFEKLKKKIYKGPDGLWYVYQEDTKAWKAQEEVNLNPPE